MSTPPAVLGLRKATTRDMGTPGAPLGPPLDFPNFTLSGILPPFVGADPTERANMSRPRMTTAYLGLGSNLGNRSANIERTLALLEAPDLVITKRSAFYETAPRDVEDQPWFLNMAVEIETALSSRELLSRIAGVETEIGRQRIVSKGPRTVDIDILLFGDEVVREPDLEIPHPRMAGRRFVLEPLAEIAPGAHHPLMNRTVREMLAAVQDQVVRRVP